MSVAVADEVNEMSRPAIVGGAAAARVRPDGRRRTRTALIPASQESRPGRPRTRTRTLARSVSRPDKKRGKGEKK